MAKPINLRRVPQNYKAVPGKQLYLKSGSPGLVQSIIDGNPKAELRSVQESLYSSEFLSSVAAPTVIPQRVDFFNTKLNQVSPNGMTQDITRSNMVQPGTIGEPEVMDVMGTELVVAYGCPQSDLNRIFNGAAWTFQFGSSQQLVTTPIHRIPSGTGFTGVGNLFEEVADQQGAPIQTNYYDMATEGKYPRRIWSQESFTYFLTFRSGLTILAQRAMTAHLVGTHYIR